MGFLEQVLQQQSFTKIIKQDSHHPHHTSNLFKNKHLWLRFPLDVYEPT